MPVSIYCNVFSKNFAIVLIDAIQFLQSRESWTSSGSTSSSTCTPLSSRRRFKVMDWPNSTMRSSSPWISSTGDFHVGTADIGEDSY